MEESANTVYQLRLKLSDISPMIWRRFLVRSDSTLADLHYTLQILMDWADDHLHCFHIKGKKYGLSKPGGITFSDDAQQITLDQLRLRPKDKFHYEYNFYADWRHEIRVEKCSEIEADKIYPVCIGGSRASPPEECEGVWDFLELRQHFSAYTIIERFTELLEKIRNEESISEFQTEVKWLNYWLNIDRFDRRNINRSLKQYADEGKNFILWRRS